MSHSRGAASRSFFSAATVCPHPRRRQSCRSLLPPAAQRNTEMAADLQLGHNGLLARADDCVRLVDQRVLRVFGVVEVQPARACKKLDGVVAEAGLNEKTVREA